MISWVLLREVGQEYRTGSTGSRAPSLGMREEGNGASIPRSPIEEGPGKVPEDIIRVTHVPKKLYPGAGSCVLLGALLGQCELPEVKACPFVFPWA